MHTVLHSQVWYFMCVAITTAIDTAQPGPALVQLAVTFAINTWKRVIDSC